MELFYIFSKVNFSYISRNGNPEKTFYVSGSRPFLYFMKQKPLKSFLNFRKRNFLSFKIKRTHSEKVSYIYSSKLKKLDVFQQGTLKSQAKKISYFLRVSKNEFIHSSS